MPDLTMTHWGSCKMFRDVRMNFIISMKDTCKYKSNNHNTGNRYNVNLDTAKKIASHLQKSVTCYLFCLIKVHSDI